MLALLAAVAPATARAQAPERCPVPSGSREVARSVDAAVFVGRSGRATFCVRHTGARGRLDGARRIALAGPFAAYLADRGPRDRLTLRDLVTGEEHALGSARDGAWRGHAVDDRGRVAWVLGRRVLAREPSGRRRVLHVHGGRPSGLRLSAGVASWAAGGRRHSARLADASCAPPVGAREIAQGERVVVARRVDEEGSPDDLFSSRTTELTWSCLRADGRQRLVASGGAGFGYGSSAGDVLVAGTFVGFARTRSDRGNGFSAQVLVFDARTATLVRQGLYATEPLRLVALDEARRLAALEVAPGRPDRLRALDANGREHLLDEAPPDTITEVVLDPGTIGWRRGGEPRSASLP